MPTNDWWSSLAFQRYAGNPYSENMYAHPLTFQAPARGLGVGYPTSPAIVADGRAVRVRAQATTYRRRRRPELAATPRSTAGPTGPSPPTGPTAPAPCARPSATACRSCTPRAPAATPGSASRRRHGLEQQRQRPRRHGHRPRLRAVRAERLDRRPAPLRPPASAATTSRSPCCRPRRARPVQQLRLHLRHRHQGHLGLQPGARPASTRPTRPDHGAAGHRDRHAPGALPPPVAELHRRRSPPTRYVSPRGQMKAARGLVVHHQQDVQRRAARAARCRSAPTQTRLRAEIDAGARTPPTRGRARPTPTGPARRSAPGRAGPASPTRSATPRPATSCSA